MERLGATMPAPIICYSSATIRPEKDTNLLLEIQVHETSPIIVADIRNAGRPKVAYGNNLLDPCCFLYSIGCNDPSISAFSSAVLL
jgi:hypothetical protein